MGFRHARNAITLYVVHDVVKRRASPLFACFTERMMPTRFKVFAIVAALAAGTSSAAMAEYPCTPGYALYGGVCRPVPAPGYPSGPLAGAQAGGAEGAASGNAAAGPVGAIVGGALGTAAGAIGGTANELAGAPPAPVCAPGYTFYHGACYPAR
jgi:hypothetical protein